jgi:hypothetical protein
VAWPRQRQRGRRIVRRRRNRKRGRAAGRVGRPRVGASGVQAIAAWVDLTDLYAFAGAQVLAANQRLAGVGRTVTRSDQCLKAHIPRCHPDGGTSLTCMSRISTAGVQAVTAFKERSQV